MKIKRISWTNYRGLEDGEIIADGHDVIVRGQNGVGKTSIASVVPFVLFGKGTAKRYEDGFFSVDDGELHGAEIEFDDEKIFRRETYSTRNGNKTICYLNGAPVKQRDYDVQVRQITGGIESAINPLSFSDREFLGEMKLDDKRNFLIKTFGAVSDEDVFALPMFANARELFGQFDAEGFMKRTQAELSKLKTDAKKIPNEIDALIRQLEDVPLEKSVKEILQADRDKLKAELEKISMSKSEVSKELSAVQREYDKLSATQNNSTRELDSLERGKKICERDIASAAEKRENLLAEYNAVLAAKSDVCPTCKRKYEPAQFERIRQDRLVEIVQAGRKAQQTLKESKQNLDDINAALAAAKEKFSESKRHEKLAELDARIKSLQEQETTEELQRKNKIRELGEEISELDNELGKLESAEKTRRDIENFRAKEKELNRRITEIDGQLNLAKSFIHRKIELAEEQINANFEHVRFKLYDFKITTGELKPTCEAMLNGVPYSALSKGEKLKAALDIFRTLQKKIGVELPLLIDDAESYTRNSFVDVANQLWLFKVSDEEHLVIEVKKEARSAA